MYKSFSLLTMLLALVLLACPANAQQKSTSNMSTIIPKNYQEMTKVVSTDTSCIEDVCYQKDVVQYYRDSYYMTINTLNKINTYGNTFAKNNLKDLNKFLENKTTYDQIDIGTLFNYNIETTCVPLGEINNISYPGTDAVRAIYVIDTDGEFTGNIDVRVFAKKGNSYILLSESTYLSTHNNMNDKPNPLYQQCLNEFKIKDSIYSTGPFMECYKHKIQNDVKIQKILRDEANTMINFFAL